MEATRGSKFKQKLLCTQTKLHKNVYKATYLANLEVKMPIFIKVLTIGRKVKIQMCNKREIYKCNYISVFPIWK